jgi:hypothetical protein
MLWPKLKEKRKKNPIKQKNPKKQNVVSGDTVVSSTKKIELE